MTAATTHGQGPVIIDGRRGWPLPDGAWDPCPPDDQAAWLPWAVVQDCRDWYIGLYSCRAGHAWTCSYAEVVEPAELATIPVSPFRIVPDDAYLAAHTGLPLPGPIIVVDWPAVR